MAKESVKSREERAKSSTSAHAFEKATGFFRKFRNWLLKLKGGSVSIIVLQPKRLMRKI